jgi:hypothetical protein
MTRNKLAPIRPMILLFVVLNGIIIAGKTMLQRFHITQDVIIMGNLVVFLVTFVSYLVLYKSLYSANPQSFVRAMYISFIIKFFVIALSAFIYIMMAKKNVDKYGLIASMFLYLVYTFMEVSALTKLLKQKTNA